MGETLTAIGVSVAVGVATQVTINALTPAQVLSSQQLKEISIPKNSYGAAIPQGWGNVRLAGSLLWSTTKREEVDRDVRGGFLKPKTITRNFYYYGSFAVIFAYTPFRPAEKLSRLSLNGKLVFDADATDPVAQQESAKFLANHVRFYSGAFDQAVDPLIQNAFPIQSYDYGLPHDPIERANALTALGLSPDLNHIPGYQYKCYLVLENLPLEDYYNQLPTVKAEIVFNSNNSLETIVTDICTQAGISNIDTTGIQNIPVEGFYLDRVTTASEALKLLQ